MNGLSLLFSGRGDEIILTVIIKKGSSSLAGEIFASESEISTARNHLTNFLSNITNGEQNRLAISFGHLVAGSPSLKIEIAIGEDGTICCVVKLSCFLGSNYEKMPDTACVAFNTNISSLDTFFQNLNERNDEYKLTAILECN
jgi:hypothetical protein